MCEAMTCMRETIACIYEAMTCMCEAIACLHKKIACAGNEMTIAHGKMVLCSIDKQIRTNVLINRKYFVIFVDQNITL